MEITFLVQHVIRQAGVKFVKVPENAYVQIPISLVTRQDQTPFMEQMEELSLLIALGVAEALPLVHPLHRAHVRHPLLVALVADVVEQVLTHRQTQVAVYPHGWHITTMKGVSAHIAVAIPVTIMTNARPATCLDVKANKRYFHLRSCARHE